jgi:hypothetical protein
VSGNRILARLSPEEFALRARREERSGRNVVLVACLFPHRGRPNGRASRFPGPARRSLVVRDAVLDHLGRLYAPVMADHPTKSLVKEFGPAIERWVARDPDNPNALEALAWLMRLRLKIAELIPARMLVTSCQTA